MTAIRGGDGPRDGVASSPDRQDDHGAFVPGTMVVRPALGDGPLLGLDVSVKDLIDIGGETTGGGNPDWARAHAPAGRDAWAVHVLREAGARVVGKTVTDELAFSLEGENAHHGTPRNPRAPRRLPGGSSSGSAVAVAAGLVDAALGTDTGGSVRIPASFCGIFGFRPTHDRVPLDGVLPFAPSYDTVGWFARSGEILERVGRVLLGSLPGSPAVPPRRLRIARDAFALCDHDVAERLLSAAEALATAHDAAAFDGEPPDAWKAAYDWLQGIEIRASLGDWIAEARPRFGDRLAPRFAGLALLEPDTAWTAWRTERRRRLETALGADDAWLLPTAPCAALPIEADDARRGDFYRHALAIGSIAGHAGLPQVTLPIAVDSDGAPLGLSLVGPRGSDERLLAFAAGVSGLPA